MLERYAARESRAAVCFSKLSIMVHCDFEKGSQNQYHSKYSFDREGGGHKKEYAVYAFANVDNSGQPQTRNRSFLNYITVGGPACLISIEAQKRNTKLCKQADNITVIHYGIASTTTTITSSW